METWFFGATNLTVGDGVVVAAVLAVLFGIGWKSGRSGATTNDFFLGGRNIPMWAACLSFVATEISAVTIIAVPATAYRENWEYLQFFVGSFAARAALAFLFIPAFYRFNCTTIYEYLRHRFGAATQYAATGFFFVTRLMGSGVRLTVAATAVSVLVGWHIVPTIILFTVIAMLYIGWGGVRAVIWTNVWQALVFIAGGIGTLAFLAYAVPGGLSHIFSSALEAGKLTVIDWGPSPSEPGFLRTILQEPNIWWLATLNGFFGSMAAYGTDHELMQRLLTLETREKSQKTTLATPFAGLGILMLYLSIGAGLYAYYAAFPAASLPAKPDNIYPHFASTEMPSLLRGLVLAAVVMASIDSPLGSLTASFVNDLYRPVFAAGRDDRHYMRVARVMVVVFGVLLAFLAYGFSHLQGFLWWAFKIGGVTFGSLLGVFLLGLVTKTKSNRANVVSMLVFAALNLALLILTERKIFIVGWTWLVLLGTFGTMILSRLLSPSLDRPASEPAS